MEVHCDEGVANPIGPEPCVSLPRGGARSVGRGTYRPASRRFRKFDSGRSAPIPGSSGQWFPANDNRLRAANDNAIGVVCGLFERSCYDGLNRLTKYKYAAGNTVTACTSSGYKKVTYDDIGNIASKSDVGTYSYPASGEDVALPHAVSSIAGTVNGVVNPTYTYDANGNMLTGAGRTVAGKKEPESICFSRQSCQECVRAK